LRIAAEAANDLINILSERFAITLFANGESKLAESLIHKIDQTLLSLKAGKKRIGRKK
jgi:hypothetical protein